MRNSLIYLKVQLKTTNARTDSHWSNMQLVQSCVRRKGKIFKKFYLSLMKIQYTRHYRTKINERYKKRSTSYKGYHNTNLIKKN